MNPGFMRMKSRFLALYYGRFDSSKLRNMGFKGHRLRRAGLLSVAALLSASTLVGLPSVFAASGQVNYFTVAGGVGKERTSE